MASYCSKCGKDLSDGIRYCPVCGFDTMSQGSGSDSNKNSGQNFNTQINNSFQGMGGMGGTLTIIFVLGLLWAIGSFLSGIYFIAMGDSFSFFFYGGTLLIVAGVLSLVSGLLALLSCMNIYKLEKHEQACLFCLIGSLIGLFTGGVIAGIVGIIFYFLMKNEKYRFKS
ncbi:MAG: zinc-ribbon domain-containing protein [Candidatus Methanoplasma sp.]|nr:zinc-ribbon domain-containing protein [Candidatus Methanoplasma sp.]